jgi:hypothetical protein
VSDEAYFEVKRFSTGVWLTLAAFADFVRDETNMVALTAELLRVTQETMQPERATIWLKGVKP